MCEWWIGWCQAMSTFEHAQFASKTFEFFYQLEFFTFYMKPVYMLERNSFAPKELYFMPNV